ncbi:MAG: lipopolysaccharide heptosyltransferase II [Bacteroidota bacterium]
MDRILIIRLSSIGDIILTTPLIRAVRKKYPKAQLDFLIKTQFKSLVEYNPHISRVITFDKTTDSLGALKQDLRKNRYDWVIDIHKNFRSYFLSLGIRAGLVTRYRKQIFKRQLLVWFRLSTFRKNTPVLERYFEAVATRGVKYDGQGTEVFLPESEKLTLKNLLQQGGYDDTTGLVAICPGASFTNKRWLADRFAELANKLATKGKKIVLLGGRQDETLCAEIEATMLTRPLNFTGKLSLLGSATLLSKVELAITNDSGLMHLAQSQGTAVVAIYGPTVKELGYFPMPVKSTVVQADVACRPCTHNGLNHCPKKHFNCMKLISTDQVFKASEQYLGIGQPYHG